MAYFLLVTIAPLLAVLIYSGLPPLNGINYTEFILITIVVSGVIVFLLHESGEKPTIPIKKLTLTVNRITNGELGKSEPIITTAEIPDLDRYRHYE